MQPNHNNPDRNPERSSHSTHSHNTGRHHNNLNLDGETLKKRKNMIASRMAKGSPDFKRDPYLSKGLVSPPSVPDVHFDFDKSTLKPEAQTILKRNIQLLKDNPKTKVRIAGYTSASGTDAYNQKLSERRANAVQEYLINEGVITRDRLTTIGYGETNPAMYEAAPKELYSAAAKANMRVLFEIIVQ
jgi:outer membrane protein OmpA-like peptidoglycan-associated protein